MPTTKTWLKVMLWAIGLGAGVGVLAVLLGAHDVVYRAMGSCFLVAGVALLMMLVSRLVDHESTRASGLLGMWLVLAIGFIALGLIWDVDRLIDSLLGVQRSRFGYVMWSTMGWLFLTGLPAMLFLRMRGTDHARKAAWFGLVLAGIVFTLLMLDHLYFLFFWQGTAAWWGYDPQMMQTGLWLGAMGILAVACLSNGVHLMKKPWRWIGIAAAAGAAGMAIYGIWTGISTDLGEKIVFTLITTAIVTAHANMMLLCPLKPQHRWLRIATIALAIATGILITLLFYYDIYDYYLDSLPERVTAALLILTFSCTLAMVILARMHRPIDISKSTKAIDRINLICPLCRTKQALPTGENAACVSCGLLMHIKITEPRCPQCDYLLYHLQSTSCPECGYVLDRQAT